VFISKVPFQATKKPPFGGSFTQHAKIRAGLMKPPVLRLNILSSPYFKPYFEVNSGLFLNCRQIISFLRKPVKALAMGIWGQYVEKKWRREQCY